MGRGLGQLPQPALWHLADTRWTIGHIHRLNVVIEIKRGFSRHLQDSDGLIL